jgi:hypothetical protein
VDGKTDDFLAHYLNKLIDNVMPTSDGGRPVAEVVELHFRVLHGHIRSLDRQISRPSSRSWLAQGRQLISSCKQVLTRGIVQHWVPEAQGVIDSRSAIGGVRNCRRHPSRGEVEVAVG